MIDDPSVPPVQGLVAGKYELLRLIGRGGMGSVWEGVHSTLGTHVAIKFIEAEFANSLDARQRFDNEARAAATIQSKHAIQIFDHGVTADGRPYIVMELLLGDPLDKRLAAAPALPLHETARVIQQVCRALHRAHERGIVHRDLKPENIFLTRGPDDDDVVAKVLDFGIAKIKSTPGALGVSSSTKTGTLLGTPFYMSPEQARGLRNVDHRSDLWSLGVIVFRCVTGVLPFDGESLGDLLVKICTADVPVPSHVLPGLPPQLDAWMARALDREPERRFQTAVELAEALAYACGVSVRRSGSSNTPDPHAYGPIRTSPTPFMTPSQVHAAQFQSGQSGQSGQSAQPGRSVPSGQFQPAQSAGLNAAQYPQPISGATAAPFTASSPRNGGSASKGSVIAWAMAAAVIGLTVGILLIVRFRGGARSQDGAQDNAADITHPTTLGTALATHGAAGLTDASSGSASATATVVADVAPTPIAPLVNAATPTSHSKPTRAGAKAPAASRPAPLPGAPVLPTPPIVLAPFPAPAPPKPPPPTGDPGY